MDGVLNDHKLQDNGYCGIKPACVENFNLLLNKVPQAQIIISSAWRYIVGQGQMTTKGFEYLLLVCGVFATDRVMGVTKSDEAIQGRGEQILAEVRNLKISKYVVLDDMDLGI